MWFTHEVMGVCLGLILQEKQMPSPGTVAPIEFKVSRGNLRAQVVFRDPRGKQHPFEVVDIDLEDRLRLRRLLFRVLPRAA